MVAFSITKVVIKSSLFVEKNDKGWISYLHKFLFTFKNEKTPHLNWNASQLCSEHIRAKQGLQIK